MDLIFKKIVLLILTVGSSLNAYTVEKNGSWFYIYNNSDIVGAYSSSWNGKYSVGCDSPKVPQNQKRYKEISSCYMPMLNTYSSQSEAKNTIIRCCKRR